jgi:5-formyltetrahydrofolate cyclo-ligase
MKAEIRRRVWSLLTRQRVALLPGAYGRTPRFHGTQSAVERLTRLEPWLQARRILILGEPVLADVRQAAVQAGKTVIIPNLVRSSEWLAEIDPRILGAEGALSAIGAIGGQISSLPEGVTYRRGKELEPVDLMVIGAVGVDLQGNRVGKGVGEADLVYALGRDREFLGADTPVIVLVHDLQVLSEPAAREATDLPIDFIITPRQTWRTHSLHIRPKGLHPSMLTARRIKTFPGLREILVREGIQLPDRAFENSPSPHL